MRVSPRFEIGLLLSLAAAAVSPPCFAQSETKAPETMSAQDFDKFVGWLDLYQKRSARRYALTGG